MKKSSGAKKDGVRSDGLAVHRWGGLKKYSKKEIKYQESNIRKVFLKYGKNKPTGNQSKFTYNPYKKMKGGKRYSKKRTYCALLFKCPYFAWLKLAIKGSVFEK